MPLFLLINAESAMAKYLFPLSLPEYTVWSLSSTYLLFYLTAKQFNISYTKGIFGLLLPSFAAKQKIKAQATIIKNSQNR